MPRLADDYLNSDQGLAEAHEAQKAAIRAAAAEARKLEQEAFGEIAGTDQAGPIEAVNDEFADKQKKLDDYLASLKEKYKNSATDLIRIQNEYNEASIALEATRSQRVLETFQAQFKGIADLFLEAFEGFSEDQRKFAVFQKAITLVQIAIDTARAISGITAAAASTSITPIDLAIKIAAGIGTVLANFARAKKLLNEPIPVKQKAEGGALAPTSNVQRPTSNVPTRPGQRVRVTGETDHRPYTATFLAPPDTGLLPPSPVVFTSAATGQPVLASERGAEYFIASHHLTHPVVNYHARAIDLITHGGRGVRQFAEGGVNTTSPIPSALSPQPIANSQQPTADTAMQRELLNAVSTLNTLLSRGIVAVIPDGTVVDIRQRFDKINGASGGFYG